MKKQLTIFMAALMILSILAAPVAAGTSRTEYEGYESFEGEIGGGRMWISDEGVLLIRDFQEAYTDVVSEPRLSGDLVVTINANFQLAEEPVYVYGPMWGTSIIENDDGYWEGSWVGKRTEEGYSYIRCVLHGHGGYEGLQARVDYVRQSPVFTDPFTVHGVLMDPGG
jgi:hypothetical protein